MDDILHDAVGVRHAFVLGQVSPPRFPEECFQEPPFLGGILEDSPGLCAVTTALVTQSLKSRKERFAVS
jgi:hypothetical protein